MVLSASEYLWEAAARSTAYVQMKAVLSMSWQQQLVLLPSRSRCFGQYHEVDQSILPSSLDSVLPLVVDEWFQLEDPGLMFGGHQHLLMSQNEVRLHGGLHEFL